MARQQIRFNYFEPKLVADNRLEYQWDMKPFLEYILANKKSFSGAFVLGDEISDLEWDSCGYDEKNDLYYIQLSRLRSKNIPSRKKLNQEKESLHLSDDEFLGEFNLLIFDPRHNVLITQGNSFGLTTKQIAMSLSNLRLKYKEKIGEAEKDELFVVSLRPIIDSNAISSVKNNDIYRKIVIKGSDYREIENNSLNSETLSSTIRALNEINGVNFEITVTMSNTPKGESLSQNEVRSMIEDVLKLRDSKMDVSMNVTSRKNEEYALENTDLFIPKLTSTIVINVKNRSTIGAEAIFQNFKEQNYYDQEKHIQYTLGKIISQN
ncbi:DUF6731 family protein [Lactococcus lactis]|uniref:DUF6731 family protein n=1 Tax=Lactococcus lactis TaxID=1358 RepID=UPI00223B1664|nr:DUF6731 family protein [Lactococcus lactis]MCT1180343.1 hypothetical protein [Lactococcus lactis]